MRSFGDWDPRPATAIADEMTKVVETYARQAPEKTPILLLHDQGNGVDNCGYERPHTVEAVRRFLIEAGKRNWQHALL